MKRFVLDAALFLLIGITLAMALAYGSNAVQPDATALEYADYAQQIQQLQEQSAEVEALAVGNSHNLALDFETLDEEGYHLWRASGDMFEVRYQLETLLPALPEVKTVYLSASYMLFEWDNSLDPEREVIRKQMYASIPSWRFLPGDVDNFALGKLHALFPVDYLLRADHWKNVFQTLLVGRGGATEQDSVVRGQDGQTEIRAYENCDVQTVGQLAEHAAEVSVPAYSGRQAEMVAQNPHLQRDTYQAAGELIQFLQARGIRVVFYTPPYFTAYTELSDPETISELRSNMRRLQQEYGVEYYDFSEEEALASEPSLYLNSDHLNLCGARMFSAQLRQRMEAHTRSITEDVPRP